MSYDVSLYFRDDIFPLQQWEQVIAAFDPQKHEVRKSRYTQNDVAEWTIVREESVLWLTLQDKRPIRYRKPAGAQWEVLISRSGHRPYDVWLQFAVPYRALVLMDNVIFYDRQQDVYLASEDEYLEFAGSQLRRLGLSKMFKLGLLDADGKVLF